MSEAEPVEVLLQRLDPELPAPRYAHAGDAGADLATRVDVRLEPGQRVLVVDDLIATGGSARAAIQLVEELGGQVVGAAFLIELTFLNGREALKGYEVFSVLQY